MAMTILAIPTPMIPVAVDRPRSRTLHRLQFFGGPHLGADRDVLLLFLQQHHHQLALSGQRLQKLQAADWNQIFRAVGPSESESISDTKNARRQLAGVLEEGQSLDVEQ